MEGFVSRERLKLVCCIGVSRKEHFSRAFLRHFIGHYLGLGIQPENFLITLCAPHRGEEIDWAVNALAQYGIGVSHHLVKEYDCYEFYRSNFELMAGCPEDH